jgi:hypothetical protein
MTKKDWAKKFPNQAGLILNPNHWCLASRVHYAWTWTFNSFGSPIPTTLMMQSTWLLSWICFACYSICCQMLYAFLTSLSSLGLCWGFGSILAVPHFALSRVPFRETRPAMLYLTSQAFPWNVSESLYSPVNLASWISAKPGSHG